MTVRFFFKPNPNRISVFRTSLEKGTLVHYVYSVCVRACVHECEREREGQLKNYGLISLKLWVDKLWDKEKAVNRVIHVLPCVPNK